MRVDSMVCAILERMCDVPSLRTLDIIFPSDDKVCQHMRPMFKAWRDEIAEDIEALKPFHAYL
jgi:hypothetical protein